LALIAGAVAVVGGGALILSYDAATKVDRSVPKVVVREYIDAALVQRSIEREQLYTCATPALGAIEDLRAQLDTEEVSGVRTQVVLVSALESGDGSTVDARIQLNQGSGIHVDRRTQHWRFGLRNEDGWRVCAAEQLPDPSPTPTPPTAG
jgi:hypothetical protein